MYGKSELALYKPSHEPEGVNTIRRDSPRKTTPNLKRAVLTQPLPRNPTPFLTLMQEISHQFGSIRLVRSAHPVSTPALVMNLCDIPILWYQVKSAAEYQVREVWSEV
jgi:hypothetical protein